MKGNRIKNLLFKAAYACVFFYAFLGHIPQISDILKVMSYASLAYVVLMSFIDAKYSFADMKRFLPLLLISCIFIITSNNFIPFKTLLLIFASSGLQFDDRIKFDFRLRLVLTVITILLGQLGIIAVNLYYFTDGSHMVKNDLGFANPNVFGMDILLLCIEYVYINRNKKAILATSIGLVVMLIAYGFSGSRTAMAAYIVFAFLMLMYKIRAKLYNNKIVRTVVILSPIVITLGTVCLFGYLQSNDEMRLMVDRYSSGRYTNARIYVERFPISPFGSDITVTERTCDVSAIYLLYSFGIIGMTIYLIGFSWLIKKLYSQNNIQLILVFLALFVYSISEKLWLYPDYNIFITAFSYVIFNRERLGGGKYE